ncbi:MAG: hypothetical protein ACRD5M_15835 [Candidatus Acidiferrales bacterium]
MASIKGAHGNTISRGPHGERRVEARRGDRRFVSTGHGRGYGERRYSRGGHEYMRRSYYRGGRYYGYGYRGYYYRGYGYYGYVPPYYYGPAYYGWAYNPWPSPVVYSWGWGAAPWYTPYNYYFTPYPSYPYAALWLTDYMIAANLQAAAEANAESGKVQSAPGYALASAHSSDMTGADSSPVLTPEVKQMIADDVKAQIAEDKEAAAAQQSGKSQEATGDQVPPSLNPNRRVFVVSATIAPTLGDEACSLTSGDVIKRTEDDADANKTVAVDVLASKTDDCAVGSTPRVQIQDLDDMHDEFRHQLEAGLKSLSENQGKSGIPSGPKATTIPNPDGQVTPDKDVADELKKIDQEADADEQDVQQAASDTAADTADSGPVTPEVQDVGNGGGQPATIQIGDTLAQVVKAMGMPKQIVNLGTSQMYVYSDLKITFEHGRVVNVE